MKLVENRAQTPSPPPVYLLFTAYYLLITVNRLLVHHTGPFCFSPPRLRVRFFLNHSPSRKERKEITWKTFASLAPLREHLLFRSQSYVGAGLL